jgi:UDP-hydrolysing UDP-N-acetyl-D-glucosamine 2-epimerase
MSSERTITILTGGRQDWGILRPVATALRGTPGIRLDLAAGGMHLSQAHGRTLDEVLADGFVPDAELDWAAHGATADEQAAQALVLVGEHLASAGSDALVIVGDRFETLAAALAATIGRVPLVHLHGGEQTLGAIDDAIRHAITKLSHLHLVSSEEHARRVIALGEDPATVHVVGAPGLAGASRTDLPDRAALAADLGIELTPPVVVVTVHPTTLDPDPAAVGTAVVGAMDAVPATYVVTLPNVDPGGDALRERLVQATGERLDRVAVPALGERRYWGLLRIADAMLGNSSSGLIEAPAVGLPVVDVGDRQAGREHGPNVLHVRADAELVAATLRRALDPSLRAALRDGLPGGADLDAGSQAAHIIATWHPSRPPRKAPIEVPG